MNSISLPEELFILALNEEKCKVHTSVAMPVHYGLGGALLADLTLHKMITLDAKSKVVAIAADNTGNEILDKAYLRIMDSHKLFKVRHWVEEFSDNIRKFQKLLAENMVNNGMLKLEEHKYQWVIPCEPYPQLNASAKYWLKNQLREVLLAGDKANSHIMILLNLVKTCGLLQFVITRDEQGISRRKIEQLTKNMENEKSVQDAIEMIKAAAAAMKY